MTYYILAIFPALAALVAIYGLFSEPASIAKQLDDVAGFIPSGAIDVAREQLTRVASTGIPSFGRGGVSLGEVEGLRLGRSSVLLWTGISSRPRGRRWWRRCSPFVLGTTLCLAS
jgi:hypothetical protein